MGLDVPAGSGGASFSLPPGLPGGLIRFRVFGIERLLSRLIMKRNMVHRSRYVGVDRAGKYLYKKKREDCKAGLYSGQEVAPNKWRYGWEHLGGPAKYEFTGSVLKAHELGTRRNAIVDYIDVSLNPATSPHATMIHGPIESGVSGLFYSPMLKKLVQTRPWMKPTPAELRECLKIIWTAYKGT